MNNHVLPQQDFFIYVPTLKEHNSCSNYLQDTSVVPATQTCAEVFPIGYESWVQIPFSDALIVYACLSEA